MLIIGTNQKFRKIRFMIMLCGLFVGYIVGYLISKIEGDTAYSLLFAIVFGVIAIAITDIMTKSESRKIQEGQGEEN